ncbi:LAMI_0B08636g1_1 [Lachancea mirantina]|uniref:LAMI_0B08636g1_1 n=1 Tax=Lachancea mirantina TaxID=1230905 RepID=A0A1G4IYK5_9SACH|nr:LAMI_0B08636g1_1 [Lachancea mirantina]
MHQECNKFLKTFKLRYPIVQAPMAGVTTPEMAFAVAARGGMGSLSLSHVNLQKKSAVLEIGKALNVFLAEKGAVNAQNVNLNFFCHPIYPRPTTSQKENWKKLYSKILGSEELGTGFRFDNGNVSFQTIETKENLDILKSLLAFFQNKFTPGVISFHFGCPSSHFIEELKKLGISVFVTVTNEFEGEQVLKFGVDGIVCQGYEAGGHRGRFPDTDAKYDECLSTLCLFKKLKQLKVKLGSESFLIPAGGIMDSQTIQFYLDQGASACQLGTAFLAAKESQSCRFFRNLINSDDRKCTLMTPLPSGLPARTLLTPFIEKLVNLSHDEDLPPYGYRYSEFKSLRSKFPAMVDFNLCGQGVNQMEMGRDECLSSQEILSNLAQGLFIHQE